MQASGIFCHNPSSSVRCVCAVSFATVRCAGLPLARHLVGAAAKHALAWTAAVFRAETLGVRVGGAAHHGAWLLSAAVFAAMRRFKFCAAGASCKLARSVCAVLLADATCFSTGGAAFLLAHCPAATAVFGAQPPCLRLGGAAVDRAGFPAM